jgi:hypothetical protein
VALGHFECLVYLNYVGLGFVIELNYAGFVIDVYMCELVFVNHVNICGRVHELTPKNSTNLSNFELTKNPPRLNQIATPPERCCTDFVTLLARLL